MLSSLIRKLRYKLWFLLDLPQLVRQHRFAHGAELGVKGGRSIKRVMAANPQLSMIGLDLWEIQPGRAYKDNNENEARCRKALKRFGNRATLYKGDARLIAEEVPDASLDFIFYDIYNRRISSKEFHYGILERWLPKLKKGGYMIGRDFHNQDVADAIATLGYEPRPCTINGRESVRLKYFER